MRFEMSGPRAWSASEPLDYSLLQGCCNNEKNDIKVYNKTGFRVKKKWGKDKPGAVQKNKDKLKLVTLMPSSYKLSPITLSTLMDNVSSRSNGNKKRGPPVYNGPTPVHGLDHRVDHCHSDGKTTKYMFSVQGRTKGLVWTKMVDQAHPIRMGDGPPGWSDPIFEVQYG